MELTGVDMGRIEKATCKEETCIGCVSIEGCEDAVRHSKNVAKKRFLGLVTHDELVAENEKRFGPMKPDRQTPWEALIGESEDVIKKIVTVPKEDRGTIISKLSEETMEMYRSTLEKLNRYGWYGPYVDGGRLRFKSTYQPRGTKLYVVNHRTPEPAEITDAELFDVE